MDFLLEIWFWIEFFVYSSKNCYSRLLVTFKKQKKKRNCYSCSLTAHCSACSSPILHGFKQIGSLVDLVIWSIHWFQMWQNQLQNPMVYWFHSRYNVVLFLCNYSCALFFFLMFDMNDPYIISYLDLSTFWAFFWHANPRILH